MKSKLSPPWLYLLSLLCMCSSLLGCVVLGYHMRHACACTTKNIPQDEVSVYIGNGAGLISYGKFVRMTWSGERFYSDSPGSSWSWYDEHGASVPTGTLIGVDGADLRDKYIELTIKQKIREAFGE